MRRKPMLLAKIQLLFLLFNGLLGSSSWAGDLGFRYTNGTCVNSQGDKGLNTNYFGQCSDFRGVTLAKFHLDGVDFSGSQFNSADLQRTTFNQTILNGVSFEGANLSGVEFIGA